MASDTTPTKETPATEKSSDATAASSGDGAPANYSRREGQKPVTKAYKDNWDYIFKKKNKKRKKS